MTKFTVQIDVPGSAADVWALLQDDTFLGEVYRTRLGYTEWTVTQRQEDESGTTVEVRLKLPTDVMPGPVVKLRGPGYMETEHRRFDGSTQVLRWNRVPSVMADKVHQEGTIRIEPVDDTGSRVVADTSVECKVFGVGGLMESATEKALREEFSGLGAAVGRRLAGQLA